MARSASGVVSRASVMRTSGMSYLLGPERLEHKISPMLDKDGAGRLFDYTVWANHRVMRAAATLSVDDFKRDLGSSFGGVRGTLCHILGAEWIWLERWKGVSPSTAIDVGEFADIVALRDSWTVIEDHRESWFKALRPEALAARSEERRVGK